MRAGMGNLLETDSDVASVSDNERERTDGDGMESDALLDTNKNVSQEVSESTKATSSSGDTDTATEKGQSYSSEQSLDSVPNVGNINEATNSSLSSSLPNSNASSTPTPSTSRVIAVSPRELPPRSQLIQLKPTMTKPRLTKRNSTESITDGINKQKNSRFVPFEPYRGAVRPIVAQYDPSKKHSRTASDASISSITSLTLEQTMNNISIDEIKAASEQNSQGLGTTKNTQYSTNEKYVEAQKTILDNINVDFRLNKQDKIIEKQTNALILLKERLKIDLHKENIRLKKLMVDSLSGDLVGRAEHPNDSMHPGAHNESVDALSNEIEVWRSKFLSSCVLMEQLTRENNTLHDAVGSAANILKEIKLASTLSPQHFEEVNAWLRQNRGTSPSVSKNCSSDDTVT